ncbi:MAG: corrinoid protein [Deltaproteobacteria bacterium]|nr:corrinoid protein [Deltaproteobacteria bacterium]
MDKDNFLEPLLTGDTETLVRETQKALEEGNGPEGVLQEGLIPAMGVVGEQFRNGEIYIPEVLLAARSMHGAMAVLKPFLVRTAGGGAGKVVIGTVKGDLHDIGKNLVVMMMEGGGYEVVDLGADVAAERFVEAVRTHKPAFVGLSALLTTTMKEMRQTLLALEKAELRKSVRVIVGGAPVTAKFAAEIGADGFAPDATSVVALMKSLG